MATGKAGSARKESKTPKRRVPPFKTRSHRVTHAMAKRMRARYVKMFGDGRIAMRPGAYSRTIFDRILAQKGCVGIRLYPAMDGAGRQTTLIVGVDAKGNDILAGIIGDTPWLCPPFCSSTTLLG